MQNTQNYTWNTSAAADFLGNGAYGDVYKVRKEPCEMKDFSIIFNFMCLNLYFWKKNECFFLVWMKYNLYSMQIEIN